LADVYFYRHELDAFFAEAEHALALNPNNATVLADLGGRLYDAGDERGVALVRKAIALDPFHPTWFNFTIALYHFERGEFAEALAAARKVEMPGNIRPRILLAGTYAELGRESEAASALGELRRVFPEATIENVIEELRKWNLADHRIRRLVAALRKAGMPEGTEE
jgi:cytochrome c-type biogenesis protein CcmH/NrfG